MAANERAQKIAYAKTVLKSGTRRVADIQKAVKAKFGTGMNFRDLGKVFPKNPGAKKKTAAKRGPGRPPRKTTAKRGPGRPPKTAKGKPGRPKGWSSDQWLLLVGGKAEVFGGQRKLEARVAELIGGGYAPSDLAVYGKASVNLTLKTTVTL